VKETESGRSLNERAKNTRVRLFVPFRLKFILNGPSRSSNLTYLSFFHKPLEKPIGLMGLNLTKVRRFISGNRSLLFRKGKKFLFEPLPRLIGNAGRRLNRDG